MGGKGKPMGAGSPHGVTVSLPALPGCPGAGASGMSVWVLHALAGRGGASGGQGISLVLALLSSKSLLRGTWTGLGAGPSWKWQAPGPIDLFPLWP